MSAFWGKADIDQRYKISGLPSRQHADGKVQGDYVLKLGE
jgi:hypothetical protein